MAEELRPRFGLRADNRVAGAVAVVAGAAAAIAPFLTWIQIEIAGRSGPGSFGTGLDGRDGRTVLVVGVLAALVGLALLAGQAKEWLRGALLAAGGVISIIGIVDIADVGAKATELEKRFGVPPDVVTADVGIGLWLVTLSGIALLVGALLARRQT